MPRQRAAARDPACLSAFAGPTALGSDWGLQSGIWHGDTARGMGSQPGQRRTRPKAGTVWDRPKAPGCTRVLATSHMWLLKFKYNLKFSP